MRILLFLSVALALSACTAKKYIMKHCHSLYDVGDHFSCEKD